MRCNWEDGRKKRDSSVSFAGYIAFPTRPSVVEHRAATVCRHLIWKQVHIWQVVDSRSRTSCHTSMWRHFSAWHFANAYIAFHATHLALLSNVQWLLATWCSCVSRYPSPYSLHLAMTYFPGWSISQSRGHRSHAIDPWNGPSSSTVPPLSSFKSLVRQLLKDRG